MLSIVKNRKHKEFQLQTVNILNTLQFKFNIFFYKIFYSFFFKLILLLCFSILTNLLLQDLTFCRPAPISNVLVDKLPNRANFVDPDFFWLNGRTNESHFFLVYKCPEIRNCVGLKFYSIEDFTTSDTISYHTVQRCCKETIISSSNTKYNGITLTCVNPVKKVMSPGNYYASDTCNSLGDYYWNFSKKNTLLIIDKTNGSKKLIGVNSSNIHILND